MVRYLKRGIDAGAIRAADAQVRTTVESILADVEARRDRAVRELSQKFDAWAPPSFKLTPQEVERAIAQVGKRDLDDIKFAQAQVRNFAQRQRETLRDLEVETLPGVILGHRHIPGEFNRLLRAGGTLSHGCFRAHVDCYRAGCGCQAHHCLRPAAQGWSASGHCCRHAFWRSR